MFKKYLNYSNMLVTGMLMIITGIMILILNTSFLIGATYLISAIFIIKAISNLIKMMIKKIDKYNTSKIIIEIILSIALATIALFIPNISLFVFSIIFGGYIIFNSFARLINYIILFKNKEKGRLIELIIFIVYFLFGLSCIITPLVQLNIILNLISIYLLVIGIVHIFSFIVDIMPNKTLNKIQRKLHIPIPIFLSILLPNSVSKTINYKVKEYDKKKKPSLYILVHVTNKGALQYGHLDICFEDKLYSFGNYDHDTLKFHEAIGDGVLYVLKNKQRYIDFCIEDTQRTIFEFGFDLTDKEKEKIQNRINKLMEHTYKWTKPIEMGKEKKERYFFATRLYKKTNATFYKFKKGKFKTFFIGSNNCVKLVQYITKAIDLNVMNNNGIITPGTYYDYLIKEYQKKNSSVITYKIYK